VPKAERISPPVQRYEAEAPHTLDLAARADIALNALTGALDPARSYELYFTAHFHCQPPVMTHEVSGLPTNNPKFAESLPMMRVMCGGESHADIERGMMDALVAAIGPDGLYYAPAEGRPWHRADPGWNPANEDFANVYGNSRAMSAMMAWYQRDGDETWAKRIDRMADGLARIAIRKDGYAYFPDPKVGESFSYPRSGLPVRQSADQAGWPTTDESRDYNFGIPMYHSGALRAFSRWYQMQGRAQDLDLAILLSRYLRQSAVWSQDAATRAEFGGHFHAHAAALRGLLEFARIAEDDDLLQFVREGYEYARGLGIPSLGWFPELVARNPCEACCTADMVALAVRLCDAGAGDYWDDVEAYVRNQLVEQQLLRADFLEQVSRDGPAATVEEPRQCSDRVIERNLGAFAGHGNLTVLPNTWIMHCCTGNATQALYYAWEAIVRPEGDAAEVNLLLNRASPWVDIDSHLPYEGKAVFHVKSARRLSVRLPVGAAPQKVRALCNGRQMSPDAHGRRLLFGDLAAGGELTIEFPVEEKTETFTLYGAEYQARFRGATAVEISPREDSPAGYPIYLRDHLCAPKAPMKKLTRYVSPVRISW
jgi:hypothetical protein